MPTFGGTKGKRIEKPDIDPRFSYGQIISWSIRSTIMSVKGSYAFRYTLHFENGEQKTFQKSGFATKTLAKKGKESLLLALAEKRHIPFSFTVKEFYDYWLYEQKIEVEDISYHTFTSYRNTIYSHMIPFWGEKRKMETIDRLSICNMLNSIKFSSVQKAAAMIVRSSFEFALSKNVISMNAAPSATRSVALARKKAEYQERILKPVEEVVLKKTRVLSAEEAALLLEKSKETCYKLYLPLLLTITAGLRISEALGVKFSDIDCNKNELHVTGQVGRTMDGQGLEEGTLYCQKIEPKTQNGYRTIPLPDFVMDEILLAKCRYDALKNTTPDFFDLGYVCFQANGKPYNRSYMYAPFRKLLAVCGLEPMPWHSLRKTYATLLAEDGISMKAVSVCMGHGSKDFTEKVYVVPKKVVYDATKEQNFVWESLKPKEKVEILEVASYENEAWLSLLR